jgi:hypothetical protein
MPAAVPRQLVAVSACYYSVRERSPTLPSQPSLAEPSLVLVVAAVERQVAWVEEESVEQKVQIQLRSLARNYRPRSLGVAQVTSNDWFFADFPCGEYTAREFGGTVAAR